MATGNFKTQNGYPLVVASDSTVYEWMTGDKLNFDSIEHPTIQGIRYNDFIQICWEEFLDEFKEELKQVNQELVNTKIDFMGGYYEGIQLYFESEYEYIEQLIEDKAEYLNEDDESYQAELYDCIEEAKDEWNHDKKTIDEFIEKMVEDYCMIEIEVIARFSNGETYYGLVK